MHGIYVSDSLSSRISEVMVTEASEKNRIFSNFLSSCGFGDTPHEDIMLEKLSVLSQRLSKLQAYATKPQSSLSKEVNVSTRLNHIIQDFGVLRPRLNSICDSIKRMSELPQLLMEVKTADMDILSDAVKSFNSIPSFYHPTNVEKLQMDASLLREKVEQLEEKLLLFRGLNTDLEAAADDVAATEAELLQLQRGDDLSHGLSGWK